MEICESKQLLGAQIGSNLKALRLRDRQIGAATDESRQQEVRDHRRAVGVGAASPKYDRLASGSAPLAQRRLRRVYQPGRRAQTNRRRRPRRRSEQLRCEDLDVH
jgi:hypothetical protein